MAEITTFPDVPVEKLKNRIKEAKEARRPYEKHWDKAKQYYDSRQWEGIKKMAWFQSEPVYNKVFEFVENMRGYLSDNKWGIDAIPATTPEGADEGMVIEMAEKMNKLLDFLWTDNRTQNKLAQVLQYVFLYGTGFMKVEFDPDNITDGGIGQIATSVLSPRYIFPAPDATDVHDADFILEHHPVSYRWVIERYPEQKEEFLSRGERSTTEYNEGRGGEDSSPHSVSEGKKVDVWECWYHDSAIAEDDDGDEVKAYPNGRWTLMTEDGFVLEDKPSEYNMFPYVRFIEIPRPAEFFGDCTVHKALGIQESINTILRSIIDNGLWLVHGIWIADSTSGVSPEKLAGYAPRDTIIKHTGTDVHRETGVALPGHVFELLKQQVEAFDRVVGLPDILRGIAPSRQPVGTVLQQQESGEVRTRERQRRVEESLADLGNLWIDVVATHWSDKRQIRTRGALGGFDMFQIKKSDLEDWRWDIQVVPGSTGPMDKQAIMAMLKEMRVEIGIQIPDSVFVRMAGVPGLEAAVNKAMAEEQKLIDEANADQAPPEMPPMPPDMGMMPPDLGQMPPDLAMMMEEDGDTMNPLAAELDMPSPLEIEDPNFDISQLSPEDRLALGLPPE